MPAEERRDGGLYISPMQLRDENKSEHEKFDNRLKRLELAVLALGLMAIGNGAGPIVAKLVGG